jgi:NDP-sugar pyrophosphorylase family protein
MLKKPVIILLAGGQSSRFWPLQDKNLISIMGQPLLAWQLEQLQGQGFKDIVVVGNNAVVDSSRNLGKVRPLYVQQGDKLPGMAGAILSVYKLYQNRYKGKPVYICNANDFYENQLHQLVLKTAQAQKADAYITAWQTDKHLPMGYLTVKNKRIVNIIEKPPKGKEPSDMVNIVAHWYNQPEILFKALKTAKSKQDDIYEVAMAGLIEKYRFQAVKYTGDWKWLKYPWDLLGVMDFFLKRIKKPSIAKSARISKKAVIKGPVVIEEGVRVFGGAVISGPAHIDRNTVVGNNALVRNSVVGNSCEIGFCTEIARSYVGDNCRLHSNYVGDSILAGQVDMGAGAVTANFRLDEQKIHSPIKGKKTDSQLGKLGTIIGQTSKIGVNASLMPGVKIGENCMVGPGVVQYKDIASNNRVILEQKISINEAYN